MTIVRILPNQMAETEYFNLKRTMHGRTDVKIAITKIRPGLTCACGQFCKVSRVDRTGFAELHGRFCKYVPGQETFIKCNHRGQAVASLVDDDGSPVIGVMTLDGLFPHEESKATEFSDALEKVIDSTML